MLGVEAQTLRRWEESGELVPDRRSAGGTRYYDVAKILRLGNEDMPTIGYARVGSHDRKNDLDRQQGLLEAFCAAKGWRHEVIAELGSGLNVCQLPQGENAADPVAPSYRRDPA